MGLLVSKMLGAALNDGFLVLCLITSGRQACRLSTFVYNVSCSVLCHTVGSWLAAYAANDETRSDTFRQSACGIWSS